MASTLQPPPTSFSLNSEHIAKTHRTLGLRCHDRYFRDAMVCDETGTKLYAFTAKDLGSSWSLRRSLVDANSGAHLLDLRHTNWSVNKWIIENTAAKEVCKIKDVTSFRTGGFTAVDVQFIDDDGGIANLEMRSFDKAGSRTSFGVQGVVVAEMTLTDNNDAAFLHKRGLDRTAWKLEVAEGVDVSLVIALAFARAEISHSWRR
ncbi:hypothetical protein D6D23_07992 [Aureobasidium pullulans]|uniref:Uncharacterized protein n=1 Tax=Aureobasidium pullulans TaxID=5580 RepID=A0A4S8VZ48_AURPU|nr:hypothetical protein D6D24_09003 [Aureobasidium pullulans]THW17692.1 hypothetical protein D6D23_07992 [Aureobasidium pullulans]THY84755.1 hypothetical protein D6C92_09155 [Aureobasidium pullulans]